MATYNTPGVYIEEISTFPPSVAAVETAIPAFIGFTEIGFPEIGDALVPTRITSLLEFKQLFGKAQVHGYNVDIGQQVLTDTGAVLSTSVSFNGTPPVTPAYYLYYSMQLFFANGGGPCYIVSIGTYDDNGAMPGTLVADFTAAIDELEKFDEPTLYVFSDINLGTSGNAISVGDHALQSCEKLQDRFTIMDIHNAILGGTETNADVNTVFRDGSLSGLDFTKYGAIYYPFLKTAINFFTDDANIVIAAHTVEPINADGTSEDSADGDLVNDETLADIKETHSVIYNAIQAFIQVNGKVTVPPSGAIAGLYARVDENRGVWKSPANHSLSQVIEPAINITNDLNDSLNIDPGSGKSVNAIRKFRGKGTLVWGARTLAGNDNEWRYISVRRFFNFVEESVKKATAAFVFEPNDANTWVKVRSMIENFLILQWRDGALAGAKPEHAFYVNVGINQTMTAEDILNGYMIVEIGMAVVRPAEFIILRFSHKMQES